MPKLDAETQKLIDAAVAEAVKGLKEKNTELLGKLSDANKIVKKFEGIDLTELQKAADKLKKIEADKDKQSGDYKALLEKATAKHKAELDAVNAQLATTQAELAKTTKRYDLTKELVTLNVDPVMLDSAVLILSDGVSYDETDKTAMFGDKPIADGLKDWVESDLGQRFVSNENSGGGAFGPGGKIPPESVFYDKKSDKYNRTEQAKLANKNPALHQKLVEQFS